MSNMVNIEEMFRNHKDTARTYKWDVILYGPGPGTADQINIRCASVAQPNPSYEPISIDIRAFSKKESGGVTWNSIDFTTFETVEYDVLNTLWTWGQKQFNNATGFQMNKRDYEGEILLHLLNLQDSVIRQWILYGCILTTDSLAQLESDKSGVHSVSFTVEYDYADLL